MTDWRETTLGNILTVIRGVSYKKEQAKKQPVNGYVPIVRATNIQDRLTFDDLVYVPSSNVSPEQRLRKNDIVIAASSGSRAVVGKAAQLNNNWEGSFGAFCFALRPADTVNPRFVGWFLQTREYRNRVSELAAGVNINNLRAKHIEETPIRLPRLNKQEQIVAEIEKQFTRLDAGVASLQRLQRELKRYRASLLNAAFQGLLVTTEADLARQENRDYESAETLLRKALVSRKEDWRGATRHKTPASLQKNGFRSLPEGWTWATADQLSEPFDNAICAGPFGTIFKAKDFRPSGVPIIFLRHVLPGKYVTRKPGFMAEEKWRELFQPYSVFGGEVLITKLGEPPGISAIYPKGVGPAMVTPDVIKLSVSERVVLSRYVMNYFNSDISRQFASSVAFGTTRLRLTLPIFRQMPVPLPPMAEQHRIVAEIERRISVIEELEAVVAANLQRAVRLRQSILRQAFA